MSRPHLPRYEDLLGAPELATLALLDATACVASLALGAAYPELATLDSFDDPPELAAAVALLTAVGELRVLLRRYRLARAHARDRPLDLPF